jgi:exopolysaccharide production protein ExoY
VGDSSLTANSVPNDFVVHAGRTGRTATLREVLPTYDQPVGGILKRAIDVLGSLVLLVLLAPLLLCTLVLVGAFVGGPVIFRHRRIGVGGTRFICYKFRTMVPHGDEVLGRYLAANPDAAEEWERTRKLRDDPRVCSVARILRKSSLDELPQLFNVLRGDMSLVGPRPIVEDEIRNYGPYFEECFQARPGLSGLWQVSGRNGISYKHRVALDRCYARRWSVWLDMRIMLKTVTTIFSFHQPS